LYGQESLSISTNFDRALEKPSVCLLGRWKTVWVMVTNVRKDSGYLNGLCVLFAIIHGIDLPPPAIDELNFQEEFALSYIPKSIISLQLMS